MECIQHVKVFDHLIESFLKIQKFRIVVPFINLNMLFITICCRRIFKLMLWACSPIGCQRPLDSINLKIYLILRNICTYHLIYSCIKNRHYFDTGFEFRYSDRMNFLTLQTISNSSLKLPPKFILNSQKIKNLNKEGQLIWNINSLK